MNELYEGLEDITFTEAERRCAVVMCLVNNNGNIENREIQKATGLTMRYIQEIRKRLEDSKNPRGVISRQRRSQEGLG